MKFQKGLSSLVLTIIHALFLLKDEFVDSAVTSNSLRKDASSEEFKIIKNKKNIHFSKK